MIHYPNAHVRHLPRTHSDHCPLLLNLYNDDLALRKIFFRFETIWMSYLYFPYVVQNTRANNVSFPHVITNFKDSTVEWARVNFGNIFKQKKKILSRLQGIQNLTKYCNIIFLQNLEHQLIKDFNRILKVEEDFWKLKSQINWLNEGDDNTKNFHTFALIRRHENHIICLILEDNSKVHDQTTILNNVYDYFPLCSLPIIKNLPSYPVLKARVASRA